MSAVPAPPPSTLMARQTIPTLDARLAGRRYLTVRVSTVPVGLTVASCVHHHNVMITSSLWGHTYLEMRLSGADH